MLPDRPPQIPWRAERTKGHGSDCVCEFCFLAPPLPTVAENLDALTEMAATLRRIESLLRQGQTPPRSTASTPTPPTKVPEPNTPDFL